MRLLQKGSLSPIRYKRWCDDCTEEVALDEIVKGVEVSKDHYVVVTEEELQSIVPEKSTSIQIVAFIHSHQIDPIYFNAHYYAGPEKDKEKPYFLLRNVLR